MSMQVLRSRLEASHHEVHEPSDTDTNSAADAVQRDFLQESACHQTALVLVNQAVLSMSNDLSATLLAAMVLLPGVNRAIFLELPGSTRWARSSLDHNCLLTSMISGSGSC